MLDAQTSTSPWLMPMVFGGLAFFRLAATSARARSKDGKLYFTGPLVYRALMLFSSAGCFSLAAMDWRSSIAPSAVLVVIGAAMLLGLPPTFIVDVDGVTRKLWWKKTAFIPWTDVTSIEMDAAGNLTLCGKWQPSLYFARYLADGAGFARAVTARAHISLSDALTPLHVVPPVEFRGKKKGSR